MIVKSKKEIIEDVIVNAIIKKNVRDQKKLLTNNNDKFALSFWKNNKFLILSKFINSLITNSFLLKNNSNYIFNSWPKICKLKKSIIIPIYQ